MRGTMVRAALLAALACVLALVVPVAQIAAAAENATLEAATSQASITPACASALSQADDATQESLPAQQEVLVQEALATREVQTPQVEGPWAEEWYTRYGNIILSTTKAEMEAAGFEPGDMVSVSFLGQDVVMPFVTSYSDVDSGSVGLFARDEKGTLVLAINMGDFTTSYGIAAKTAGEDGTYEWVLNDGVTDPVEFTITMHEKAGYLDEYIMRQLSYSNDRADYSELSDEQFANFREVTTTGMGAHTLYRSSSPVDNRRGRAAFADAALRKAEVSIIIDLTDEQELIETYPDFEGSYYSTTSYIGLGLGMDFSAEHFKSMLASGLRFLMEESGDSPTTFAIHCTEGKDRTGFVIAVLECLMGASLDEVKSDYMTSYANFYGISSSDSRYERIVNGNIYRSLSNAFGVSDLSQADLTSEAEEYLQEAGLTAEEIARLKEKLGEDNHRALVDEGFAPACDEAGLSDGSHCSICDAVLEEQVVIPALGHDWGEWTTSKEPTATQDGLRTRVCKRDATHVESELIPATGTPDAEPAPSEKPANKAEGDAGRQATPSTGDESTAASSAGIALAAGLAMVLASFISRRAAGAHTYRRR